MSSLQNFGLVIKEGVVADGLEDLTFSGFLRLYRFGFLIYNENIGLVREMLTDKFV